MRCRCTLATTLLRIDSAGQILDGFELLAKFALDWTEDLFCQGFFLVFERTLRVDSIMLRVNHETSMRPRCRSLRETTA